MKIVSYHKYNGFLWFRIFGYGLVIKNVRKHGMMFSERVGHTKFIKIGRYLIRTLTPKNIINHD